MNRLYITDKGKEVPVGELELLLNRQQVILGNAERDLILRTAGNIKIQVGNKFFDLPINTDSNGSSTITSGVIMLDFASDLLDLDYPEDGSLIFIRETGTLYIAANGLYIKLNSAEDDVDNSKIYLSYQDAQTLDGIQKYTVLLNAGYVISSIQDVINYSVQDVYPNQVIFSTGDGAHYQLTDDNEPNNVDHWKRLYTSLDGDIMRGKLIMGDAPGGAFEVRGEFNTPFLSPSEPDFRGYYLGKEYSKGFGMWQDDNTTYLSSQDVNGGTIKFLIGGANTNPYNPLTIGNNNVGVGFIDYAYNFNVGGTSNFVGSVNLTNEMKSKDFVTGIDGVGFSLARDYNNKWTLEVDNLIVRSQTDVEKKYNTKAVNGSLILNFDMTIISADIIESIPLYLERTKVGRYLANGSELDLTSKMTYVTAISIDPSTIDTPSEVAGYRIMKLAYGIGDRDNTGSLATYNLFNKDVTDTLYTPDGTHRFDAPTQQFVEDPTGTLVKVTELKLYMLTIKGDVNNYSIGDLFYHRVWNEDKQEDSTFYVEVVNILDDALYVYSYGDDLDLITDLIKIGNIVDQECFTQLNGANKDSFIELNSEIESFNNMIDNIYFDESLIEIGSEFSTDTVRFRSGELSKIEDLELGLNLGNGEIGIYSDNAYIKGNLVANRLVLGNTVVWDGATINLPGYQKTITLTTLGTGAATFINNVLNIPTPVSAVITADNGLTKTSDNIQLGGTLLKNTAITTAPGRGLNISGSGGGVLDMTSSSSVLGWSAIDSTPTKFIRFGAGTSGISIQDDFGRGVIYNGDYEPNFIARSLITKQYAESLVNAITYNNGLIKGTNLVQFGGPLVKDTYINTGEFIMRFGGRVIFEGTQSYVYGGIRHFGRDENNLNAQVYSQMGPTNSFYGIMGDRTSITQPYSRTGIAFDKTTGVPCRALFYDDNDSFGMAYENDFSVKGKLNDRWIPDWGAVKSLSSTANNGLTKTLNNIQLGGVVTALTIVGSQSNSNTYLAINPGVGSALVYTNSVGWQTKIDINTTTLGLIATNTTGNAVSIVLPSNTATGILVTDNIAFKGIVYNANYAANFTNRSLVDKEYVDNAVSGGGLGTVTSVAMSVPTGFTIVGSPITTAGTLALGFDPAYSLPSITKQTNWDTAYSWGNHAGLYYPLSSNPSGYLTTETDPTVPSHVKAISTTNISNWNTAFGWGNHATAGYQGALTLTTTGSGAATLVGNVLNIPVSSGASYTFGNGLKTVSGSTIEVGGTLTKHIDFNQAAFDFTFLTAPAGAGNNSGFMTVRGINANTQAASQFGYSDGDTGLVGSISFGGPKKMSVVDGVLNRGFVNDGDYEANFIARSLVTKQYVDSLSGGLWTTFGSVYITPTSGKLLSLGSNSVSGTIVDIEAGSNSVGVRSVVGSGSTGVYGVSYDHFAALFSSGSSSGNPTLKVNNTSTGPLAIFTKIAGGSPSNVLTIANNGDVTSLGKVTATSFFKSSDMRLKDKVDFSIRRIDAIEAFGFKFKTGDGRLNYGYSAQQVQSIFPSAVIKGEDGYLKVDYESVLVAKVDRLEKEVKGLKEQLNKLK